MASIAEPVISESVSTIIDLNNADGSGSARREPSVNQAPEHIVISPIPAHTPRSDVPAPQSGPTYPLMRRRYALRTPITRTTAAGSTASEKEPPEEEELAPDIAAKVLWRRTQSDISIALENPEVFCATVARAAMEVLAGARSPAQLARLLHPREYDRLRRRAGLVNRVHGPRRAPALARIRRMRTNIVSERAREVSVVVEHLKRIRAVAMRIEEQRGRWIVTVLEIG